MRNCDKTEKIDIQNQLLENQHELVFAPKFKPLEAETDVPQFSLSSQEHFEVNSSFELRDDLMKQPRRKFSEGIKLTFLRFMTEKIDQIQKRRALSL